MALFFVFNNTYVLPCVYINREEPIAMILYDSTISLANQTKIDPDTGEAVYDYAITSPAKVQRKYQQVLDFNGNKVVSQFTVYLPPTCEIGIKDKLLIDNQSYSILMLTYQTDVFGKLVYIKVHC